MSAERRRHAALPLALAVLALAPAATAQYPNVQGGQTRPAPTAQPTATGYPPVAPPGQPGANNTKNPSRTEQDLKRAEEQDSGRGLEWFYVGAEGGVFWLGADALSSSGGPLLLKGKASGVGPGGSLFLGGRFYVLTAGARVRTAWLPDSQFLSAGAEAALHIPMGQLEPYAWLGAGYATLLGVDEKVRGFDVVLGGGLDYYLSNNFSLGGLAAVELVDLNRSATAAARKASAVGIGVSGSVVLGLHF